MNEVYLQQDIQNTLRRLILRLRAYENISVNEFLSTVDNKIKSGTKIQFLFGIKGETTIESKLLEVIVTHLISAERFGPGAFEMTLKRSLEKLEYCLKGFKQQNIPEYSSVISSRPSMADVDRVLSSTMNSSDKFTTSILLEAIKLSGFGGRIIIEKTQNISSSVELNRGYNFTVKSIWPTSMKFVHPRVFVIDGYIETVSEIHHLLEAASETKESVVLFARGMSNDVIHTLRTNFDRGTLKIAGIIVPFDIDGINTVNDISIVTGANLISSTKGDLISSLKFNEAPRVDSTLIYSDRIIIQESKTGRAVATQISFLKQKRNDSKIDTGEIFNKRIRSLSPSQVIIRLPDNKDFVRSSQAIDIALRKFKALVDFGTIDGEISIVKIAAEIYSSKCVETVMSLGAIVSNLISSDSFSLSTVNVRTPISTASCNLPIFLKYLIIRSASS